MADDRCDCGPCQVSRAGRYKEGYRDGYAAALKAAKHHQSAKVAGVNRAD